MGILWTLIVGGILGWLAGLIINKVPRNAIMIDTTWKRTTYSFRKIAAKIIVTNGLILLSMSASERTR